MCILWTQFCKLRQTFGYFTNLYCSKRDKWRRITEAEHGDMKSTFMYEIIVTRPEGNRSSPGPSSRSEANVNRNWQRIRTIMVILWTLYWPYEILRFDGGKDVDVGLIVCSAEWASWRGSQYDSPKLWYYLQVQPAHNPEDQHRRISWSVYRKQLQIYAYRSSADHLLFAPIFTFFS